MIFLDGMTVLGVTKWKHTIMYWAVRLFGRDSYSGRNIMEKVCSQKKRARHGTGIKSNTFMTYYLCSTS
ncbi:hypothetical protein IB493_005064 [Salmonella enterica]|nr:hypothetical protein [Salmonella enterica]